MVLYWVMIVNCKGGYAAALKNASKSVNAPTVSSFDARVVPDKDPIKPSFPTQQSDEIFVPPPVHVIYVNTDEINRSESQSSNSFVPSPEYVASIAQVKEISSTLSSEPVIIFGSFHDVNPGDVSFHLYQSFFIAEFVWGSKLQMNDYDYM